MEKKLKLSILVRELKSKSVIRSGVKCMGEVIM